MVIFFYATATSSIYTLSLHDALPISVIVDLRRANEREKNPSRRWDGFSARVIENDIGQEAADEWATFITGSDRSEEHTSELQSRRDLVCRLLLEKKKQ